MSMFDAYRLIPEDYIPDNIHITDQVYTKIKKPLVSYNKLGDPVGFTWNQSDTVCLEFITTGNVVYEDGDVPDIQGGFIQDAETYFNHSPKVFQLSILDFRYNVVGYVEVPAKARTVILSTDFNCASLSKGIYKLQLNLVEPQSGIQYQLIDKDSCQIFIR